jgi:hypothetical protein
MAQDGPGSFNRVAGHGRGALSRIDGWWSKCGNARTCLWFGAKCTAAPRAVAETYVWASACDEKSRIDLFKKEQVKENGKMLWTIFVILLVLWLLGLVTSYTLGGFIHILLLLAVVVLVINLMQGRRVV